MDIGHFKAGHFRKQQAYSSFTPSLVNHEWRIDDVKLNKLLNDATQKIAELNALSQFIPDVDFFIKMHIAKEATQSSRIEGTRTTMEEVLQSAEYIHPERRDDWQEVHNYIDAMNQAIRELDSLPISTRLLKQVHQRLMHGVRGKNKMPGEFRSSQNWIGGATLTDAVYIPPHHTEVPELMSDLEKFLNNDDLNTPHLLRIGIAHYQFESIHPFLDGNGRVGRLLITLYLVSHGILSKPALYISDFLERHRAHYYDNLSIVRTQNNMIQWLTFFLVGVIETAQNSLNTFNRIVELRKDVEEKKIPTLGKRTPSALRFMRYLYTKPIVDTTEVAKELNVNISTSHRLIQEFEKLGILKEQTGFKRNRVFIFKEYLELFSK